MPSLQFLLDLMGTKGRGAGKAGTPGMKQQQPCNPNWPDFQNEKRKFTLQLGAEDESLRTMVQALPSLLNKLLNETMLTTAVLPQTCFQI